jgi:histidinol dehydrogenase
MTCIPASVAGVEDICIVTPPGPDGRIDAASLVAARAAGVSKIYKVGGAQAIAAVAYGTKTISRYAKVVGPGSPWVVAAKRLLADLIHTGTPAGPSEAIIFADATTDGHLAALDLLIEAEHGDDSPPFIVTTSKEVADGALPPSPPIGTGWAQRVNFTSCSAQVAAHSSLAKDTAEAMTFINDYAPEHCKSFQRNRANIFR